MIPALLLLAAAQPLIALPPDSTATIAAFVDWKLAGESLGLRGGLILVPMGVVNPWHEPPVFHGVERPRFDQRVARHRRPGGRAPARIGDLASMLQAHRADGSLYLPDRPWA